MKFEKSEHSKADEAMNCKLEKFWNKAPPYSSTIATVMNCKLEKFWNAIIDFLISPSVLMNCKLEKFWNMIENGQVGAFS